MEFKGYAKLVNLSKDKLWPEDAAYITVKKRAKEDAYIKIKFTTWIKNTKENTVYLDSATSAKINKALNLLHEIESWKAKIIKT